MKRALEVSATNLNEEVTFIPYPSVMMPVQILAKMQCSFQVGNNNKGAIARSETMIQERKSASSSCLTDEVFRTFEGQNSSTRDMHSRVSKSRKVADVGEAKSQAS